MQVKRTTDAPRNPRLCRLSKYNSARHRTNHRLVGVPLAVPKGIGELFQRAADQLCLLPQIGRQETVGVGNSGKGSLEGVLEGLGRAGRRGVGVLDTGKLE
jgi:hypothetical protein